MSKATNKKNNLRYIQIFGKNHELIEKDIISRIEKYMLEESLIICKNRNRDTYTFWIYLYDICIIWFKKEIPKIDTYNELITLRRRIGRLKGIKNIIDDKMENVTVAAIDTNNMDINLRIQRLEIIKNIFVRQLKEEQEFKNIDIKSLQSYIMHML